jgi:hypothetical protein
MSKRKSKAVTKTNKTRAKSKAITRASTAKAAVTKSSAAPAGNGAATLIVLGARIWHHLKSVQRAWQAAGSGQVVLVVFRAERRLRFEGQGHNEVFVFFGA